MELKAQCCFSFVVAFWLIYISLSCLTRDVFNKDVWKHQVDGWRLTLIRLPMTASSKRPITVRSILFGSYRTLPLELNLMDFIWCYLMDQSMTVWPSNLPVCPWWCLSPLSGLAGPEAAAGERATAAAVRGPPSPPPPAQPSPPSARSAGRPAEPGDKRRVFFNINADKSDQDRPLDNPVTDPWFRDCTPPGRLNDERNCMS